MEKIKDIKTLLTLFESSSLNKMKINIKDDICVEFERGYDNLAAPIQVVTPSNKPEEISLGEWVEAPIVGTYYQSASANGTPLVKVGQQVTKGETVCIIEAMKVMNEIVAPIDGEIVSIQAQNGQVVGFSDRLICIKPYV